MGGNMQRTGLNTVCVYNMKMSYFPSFTSFCFSEIFFFLLFQRHKGQQVCGKATRDKQLELTCFLTGGWRAVGVARLGSPQCGCCSSIQGVQLTSHSCWGLMTEHCKRQQQGHFLNSGRLASNWFWHSNPRCLSHSQLRKITAQVWIKTCWLLGNSEWTMHLMKKGAVS